MPSKITVCEQCGVGWITKGQRKWYPWCWHCGCAWGNAAASTSESEDSQVWAWPAKPAKARQIRQAQRAAEHQAAGQVTKPVFKALHKVWPTWFVDLSTSVLRFEKFAQKCFCFAAAILRAFFLHALLACMLLHGC